jgi:hypothetical protein
VWALRAAVSPEERRLVARLLTDAERRLFERMPIFDQRHSLDVLHALARAGDDDPHLLRAALLHDCGKVDDEGRPIPLLYYGVFVVLLRLAPGLYRRAARDGRGPLRPFATHAAHEERAAALAEAAGAPPETLAILRDYAARRRTPHTLALAQADDLS